MNQDKIPQSDLSKLAWKIQSLKKPILNEQQKFLLKYSIMSKGRVYAEKILSERIAEVSKDVGLDVHTKTVIKEKVFDGIEERLNRGWSWTTPFWSNAKKVLSGVMTFLIMFGAYTYLNIDTQVVRAHNFTKLGNFSGDLKIYRNGNPVATFVGMEIKEKDRVKTGEDAIAVIEYHDDSITRLGENTEILIKELDSDDDEVTRTYVEIDVIEGNVWSKVVNLVEEDSSFVVVANDIAAEATKAAFNVAVNDDEVEIEVFDHTVEIKTENSEIKKPVKRMAVVVDEEEEDFVERQAEFEVTTQEKKTKSRLYSGDKAIFKEGKEYVAVADIEDKKEESDDWVKQNLEEDKNYVEKVERRIVAQKSESIGLSESDDVKYESTIREGTRLFFTFDDVEELKLELDLAEKNFIAAEIKLEEDFLDSEERMEAETELLEFADLVIRFHKKIAEVREVDPEYADDLNKYLKKKLKLRKKELATLLPDSNAYIAKEIIEQLAFLTADSEEELTEMKYNKAIAKLAEIESLIESGDEELAISIAADYEDEIKDVKESVALIEEGKQKEKKEVVEEIVSSPVASVTAPVVSDYEEEDLTSSVTAPVIKEVEPIIVEDIVIEDDSIKEEDVQELEEQVHDIILELEAKNPELKISDPEIIIDEDLILDEPQLNIPTRFN